MTISQNLELNIPSMEDAPNAEFIFYNFSTIDEFAGYVKDSIQSIGTSALNANIKAELAQEKVEGLEETVSNLSGVVVTASEKAGEALAGVEVANGKVSELTAQMGDIETALDTIIAIQEELIGGDGV